jgi:hypothetical protein
MPAKKSTSKSTEESANANSTSPTKRSAVGLKDDILSREQILRKYWDLANLDPEVTKGNITGQLKALDSLREELVLPRPATESNNRSTSQEIYQSAWLRSTATRAACGSAEDE